MVETVHAFGAHAFVAHIAVPAFPYSGGAIVNGVEPAGVLMLEQ